jgi:stage V sporulation protein B
MISRVWSLSLLFSLGVAGVLICFSGEIGAALYPSSDAGYYIRILAPLVPIMYLDTATDAMMKGLGEQLHSMKINIADAAISLLMVILLVPQFGIWGYIVTIYVSELFNTVCSITHLLMISRTPVRLCKWIYKPLFCIVCSTSVVRFLLEKTAFRVESAAFSIILHIIAVILVYVLLLRLTRAVEKDDVVWVKGLFSSTQKIAQIEQ